jgi:hypothetical protein
MASVRAEHPEGGHHGVEVPAERLYGARLVAVVLAPRLPPREEVGDEHLVARGHGAGVAHERGDRTHEVLQRGARRWPGPPVDHRRATHFQLNRQGPASTAPRAGAGDGRASSWWADHVIMDVFGVWFPSGGWSRPDGSGYAV